MKKIILVLTLVLCLSFTLVACGEPKDSATNSQQTSQSGSRTGKVQKPANHDENAPPTEEELANAKG